MTSRRQRETHTLSGNGAHLSKLILLVTHLHQGHTACSFPNGFTGNQVVTLTSLRGHSYSDHKINTVGLSCPLVGWSLSVLMVQIPVLWQHTSASDSICSEWKQCSPQLVSCFPSPRILKGSQDLSGLHSVHLNGTLPLHTGNPCFSTRLYHLTSHRHNLCCKYNPISLSCTVLLIATIPHLERSSAAQHCRNTLDFSLPTPGYHE